MSAVYVISFTVGVYSCDVQGKVVKLDRCIAIELFIIKLKKTSRC